QASNGGDVKLSLATFKKNFPKELIVPDKSDVALDIVDYAASQRNSLVAAGGWCSPSETLYSVCEMETDSGLIDLPEVQAGRGGIRHSTGPNFSSIYTTDGLGFTQTEAQAIANTEKTCVEVPCPSFTDVRLDLIGVCITAGILQNVAYPEF